MRYITLVLTMLLSGNTMATTCWERINDYQKAIGKVKPNTKLSKYMCVGFKDPVVLERAVIIATLESSFENINSTSKDDIGVFQVHVDTIADYKLDPQYLETNLFYQFHVFRRVMKDKLRMCHDYYTPEACWHSKTKHHHIRYARKYRLYRKIYRGRLP